MALIGLIFCGILEHLTRQRRAPAGSAVDDDGFGRFKFLVVVRKLGVGTELQ